MSSLDKILEVFKRQKAKLIVLLCHHNADPDAFCSAYALHSLFKRIRPRLRIEMCSSNGLSRLSKSIQGVMPIEFTKSPKIEAADVLIMLDTNTVHQLGEFGARVKKSDNPVIIIDHHVAQVKNSETAELKIVNEKASSTCEIVFQIFKEANIPIREDEAFALLTGIAFDSGHFTRARGVTFRILTELVELGSDVDKAIQLLTVPMDSSERAARFKAAQRGKIIKEKNWVIVTSQVGSFQASAARALLRLGADIVFVAGKKRDNLTISIRSTQKFYRETGINLGKEIVIVLEEKFNGRGGGHSTSAGFNGIGDVDEALKLCVISVLARLREIE
jgi:nanoRNase/pAp phosphatase (c-di-AMP/oligoRNAs hydrolase)